MYGDDLSALTNFSDMPSINAEELKTSVERNEKNCDIKTSKRLELRSWDTKKVKGILRCFNCGKG